MKRSKSKKVNVFWREKKVKNQKIAIKIVIKTYYLVSIVKDVKFEIPVTTSEHFFHVISNFFFKSVVDHTRIKLKDADPKEPGSDYINANLIKVSRPARYSQQSEFN